MGQSALGASEPGLELRGSGACPSPRAVRSAILQLTSAERRRQLPEQATVEVVDRGATYDVVVQSSRGTVERSFDDEARDCERRVRFAAVFAVVTLLPPDIDVAEEPAAPPPPSEPPPPPPAPPPPPPPPPPSPRAPLVRLELGALAELAPGFAESLRATHFGAELRGVLGRGRLAALVVMAYAPAQEVTLDALDAHLARVTGALGGRLDVLRAPLALSLDLAFAAMLERFSDASVRDPAGATLIELGIRAGLVAALPVTLSVRPFFGLSATVMPAPREIEIAPSGTIGRTPPLWLGASAGVELSL